MKKSDVPYWIEAFCDADNRSQISIGLLLGYSVEDFIAMYESWEKCV